MPLIASCDALYFPELPRDNIIGLTWRGEDQNGGDSHQADAAGTAPALEPNTTLIYKIKSTAPQLFHVRPHFGALLLADPTAMATPTNFQTASVHFGLRSNYAEGNAVANDASPNGDSATVATRKTAPYSADSPGSSRHQERFVVDYAVVTSEPLAYQQIAQAFHDVSKLTEVVKSVWALISSGAVARSHVSLRGQIGLKVYMGSHVVLQEADAAGVKETRAVVVPSHAKLVPCSMVDRASSSMGRASRGGQSPTTGGSVGNSGNSPSKKADALRSLKEEVKALRQEVRTPQEGGSNHSASSPNSATRSPMPTTPDLAAARRHLQMQQQGDDGKADAGEDILMRVNLDPNMPTTANAGGKGGKTPKKKKGVKLYMLLAIMFAVYCLCMLMRRGGDVELLANVINDSRHDGQALTVAPCKHKKLCPPKQKRLPAPDAPGATALDL